MITQSYSELRKLVLEIIDPKLKHLSIKQDDMGDNTDLLVSGILDSFDFLDLISELEERSGIPVDLAAIDNQDIGTIKGLVEAVLAQKQ